MLLAHAGPPCFLFAVVNLTAQSANHVADRELCLHLLGWAKSCTILDDGDRNPTDETPSGTVMEEVNDESSGAKSDDVGLIYKLWATRGLSQRYRGSGAVEVGAS